MSNIEKQIRGQLLKVGDQLATGFLQSPFQFNFTKQGYPDVKREDMTKRIIESIRTSQPSQDEPLTTQRRGINQAIRNTVRNAVKDSTQPIDTDLGSEANRLVIEEIDNFIEKLQLNVETGSFYPAMVADSYALLRLFERNVFKFDVQTLEKYKKVFKDFNKYIVDLEIDGNKKKNYREKVITEKQAQNISRIFVSICGKIIDLIKLMIENQTESPRNRELIIQAKSREKAFRSIDKTAVLQIIDAYDKAKEDEKSKYPDVKAMARKQIEDLDHSYRIATETVRGSVRGSARITPTGEPAPPAELREEYGEHPFVDPVLEIADSARSIPEQVRTGEQSFVSPQVVPFSPSSPPPMMPPPREAIHDLVDSAKRIPSIVSESKHSEIEQDNKDNPLEDEEYDDNGYSVYAQQVSSIHAFDIVASKFARTPNLIFHVLGGDEANILNFLSGLRIDFPKYTSAEDALDKQDSQTLKDAFSQNVASIEIGDIRLFDYPDTIIIKHKKLGSGGGDLPSWLALPATTVSSIKHYCQRRFLTSSGFSGITSKDDAVALFLRLFKEFLEKVPLRDIKLHLTPEAEARGVPEFNRVMKEHSAKIKVNAFAVGAVTRQRLKKKKIEMEEERQRKIMEDLLEKESRERMLRERENELKRDKRISSLQKAFRTRRATKKEMEEMEELRREREREQEMEGRADQFRRRKAQQKQFQGFLDFIPISKREREAKAERKREAEQKIAAKVLKEAEEAEKELDAILNKQLQVQKEPGPRTRAEGAVLTRAQAKAQAAEAEARAKLAMAKREVKKLGQSDALINALLLAKSGVTTRSQTRARTTAPKIEELEEDDAAASSTGKKGKK